MEYVTHNQFDKIDMRVEKLDDKVDSLKEDVIELRNDVRMYSMDVTSTLLVTIKSLLRFYQ